METCKSMKRRSKSVNDVDVDIDDAIEELVDIYIQKDSAKRKRADKTSASIGMDGLSLEEVRQTAAARHDAQSAYAEAVARSQSEAMQERSRRADELARHDAVSRSRREAHEARMKAEERAQQLAELRKRRDDQDALVQQWSRMVELTHGVDASIVKMMMGEGVQSVETVYPTLPYDLRDAVRRRVLEPLVQRLSKIAIARTHITDRERAIMHRILYIENPGAFDSATRHAANVLMQKLKEPPSPPPPSPPPPPPPSQSPPPPSTPSPSSQCPSEKVEEWRRRLTEIEQMFHRTRDRNKFCLNLKKVLLQVHPDKIPQVCAEFGNENVNRITKWRRDQCM